MQKSIEFHVTLLANFITSNNHLCLKEELEKYDCPKEKSRIIQKRILTSGSLFSMLESKWNLTRFFNCSRDSKCMEDSLLVDMVRFCKFPMPSKPLGEIFEISFTFKFKVTSFGTF